MPPNGSQRVTVDEAVAAYTRGAAYAEHAEDEKGTLEEGMLADAVVLLADPHEEPDRIEELDVELTVLDGEIVFDGQEDG